MGWSQQLRRFRPHVEFRLARSEPTFLTQDVAIGEGVHFGRNVRFNCDHVRLGDGVIIGDNVVVDAESVEIGDFATVYPGCFFPGPGSLEIGHNFWLGRDCIVDSMGGTRVGNNVGVGPQSQLWTHMMFGDVLYGCRFHSAGRLEIGNDVWFVGHCLVSPIQAGDRSLAMLGSLVTKDMQADRSYAGTPAIDVTDKLGSQFAPRPVEERAALLSKRIEDFARRSERKPSQVAAVVTDWGAVTDDHAGVTVFNVSDRTYTKLGTNSERSLMRFLLPDAKFVPRAV
jgi:acetyltransferase-like isoleucine patch superfamily enzyme